MPLVETVRVVRTVMGVEKRCLPVTHFDAIIDREQVVNDYMKGYSFGVHFSDDFFYRPSLPAVAQTTVTMPKGFMCVVNGKLYKTTANVTLNLNAAASWDTASCATAANRNGKNYYIYAVEDANSDETKFILSPNSTYPTGYNADTSRKIGGFHCLCVAVGTISGHQLNGYAVGSILPRSIWDLWHRPVSNPEGMVYSDQLDLWVDIYLPSVSGTSLVSVYGGTIADGASSPAFHWYKFCHWFQRGGKRLPTQPEFMLLAVGSNVQTNIYGSADPGTTGGHKDTNNRRMISHIGCEDCCGVMWQWGLEGGGPNSGSSWANAYDGNDAADMRGSHLYTPTRALFSADWSDTARCGPSASYWSTGPLALHSNHSGRGVSEPRQVAHAI